MSTADLICPKCQSNSCTNHGSVRGEKRFLCRSCGFVFVGSTNLTMSIKGAKSKGIKAAVMKLYLKRNSYRDIEDITTTLGRNVSRNTFMNWVKKRDLKFKKIM